MIDNLPILAPDPVRAKRLRARCHDQLARQRQSVQDPPVRLGLEGTIVSGVCVLFLSAVMLTAVQVLSGR